MGKPQFGDVFYNMKQTKRQYKFAVRRLQRCQKIMKNDNLINSLLQNNKNSNIFDEIKKIRGKTNLARSSRIDGTVGSKEIAN